MKTNTLTQPSPASLRPLPPPVLPQKKAFVLRFAAEAGPETGVFLGRVEHVTSGDQAAFASVDQLWSFVRSVLSRPEVAVDVLPLAVDSAQRRPAVDSAERRFSMQAAERRLKMVPALPAHSGARGV